MSGERTAETPRLLQKVADGRGNNVRVNRLFVYGGSFVVAAAACCIDVAVIIKQNPLNSHKNGRSDREESAFYGYDIAKERRVAAVDY